METEFLETFDAMKKACAKAQLATPCKEDAREAWYASFDMWCDATDRNQLYMGFGTRLKWCRLKQATMLREINMRGQVLRALHGNARRTHKSSRAANEQMRGMMMACEVEIPLIQQQRQAEINATYMDESVLRFMFWRRQLKALT